MNEKNINPQQNKPKEIISFAIPSAEYPDVRNLARELFKVKGIIQHKGAKNAERRVVEHVEIMPSSVVKMMSTVATNAWKLKGKMIEPSGETKEEFKRIYRHVEAILESLTEVGLEIKDRTGEIFDYGLPEKVVTAQPRSGIMKELVIETLKPTIYFNHQIIQHGEVVIATPETEKTQENSSI